MALNFSIANCVAWAPGLETKQDWQLWQSGEKSLADELTLPKLASIPAMQRRRLSPFAKVALHCALEASGDHQADIPLVFSSRHGDLHRTTSLIENIAAAEDLSPTQFGLSVHNAAAGLFSIFTGNRAPISAVSGGQTSFMQGFLDSVAKMHANKLPRILYVFCDLQVPECYRPYVSDDDDIAIGLLLEPAKDDSHSFNLEYKQSEGQALSDCQALSFMDFILSSNHHMQANVHQQNWHVSRLN
ncbi:beta-ketoacyl synthase chain length factor [uncultured Paraglaciecola sp.]|uniref:beta-ketoacyl synthase chain length factor n=1 Tax=uncultured Paraglaciecola sp. TaxID=1765024 RepID=UPI0026027523|nr:beta-ketoacyl synthase chain length factor [uncultured Paraglaciecola sp.]